MNSNYKMKAVDIKVYRKRGNPLDKAKENISTMP